MSVWRDLLRKPSHFRDGPIADRWFTAIASRLLNGSRLLAADFDRFIVRPYRYVTEPRRANKRRAQLVLSLYAQGMPPEEIRSLTRSPRSSIQRVIADYEAGRRETDLKRYMGRARSGYGSCAACTERATVGKPSQVTAEAGNEKSHCSQEGYNMFNSACSGSLVVLALFVAPCVFADETKINKLKHGDKPEKLAAAVGEMIVNAAHPTGRKVAFVRHELKDDPKKEGRKLLLIKMEYFGAITGKRYVSDIELKIEATRSGWEVLDIDYSDNNNIKANLENISQLKKKLNQVD